MRGPESWTTLGAHTGPDGSGASFTTTASLCGAPFVRAARPAGVNRSTEAQDELRVVGHLVRSPRRVERQLQLDVLDALDLSDGAVDVLRDQRPGRAAHRGQAVDDLGRRVLHLDLVEEPEVDDVHPELGILDLAEHLEHVFPRRHAASVETRTIPAWS